MTRRRSKPLAMVVYDRLAPHNEPLGGDLLEELSAGRSPWWLWRQVLAAMLHAPRPAPRRLHLGVDMLLAGAAVLVLLSFEVVFVVNLVHRLVFGPPLPNITGAFHLAYGHPPPPLDPVQGLGWLVPVGVFAAAMPMGWLVARLHRRHYALSVTGVIVGVLFCAMLTLPQPFAVQFLSALACVTGLLCGGALSEAGSAGDLHTL